MSSLLCVALGSVALCRSKAGAVDVLLPKDHAFVSSDKLLVLAKPSGQTRVTVRLEAGDAVREWSRAFGHGNDVTRKVPADGLRSSSPQYANRRCQPAAASFLRATCSSSARQSSREILELLITRS